MMVSGLWVLPEEKFGARTRFVNFVGGFRFSPGSSRNSSADTVVGVEMVVSSRIACGR